MSQTWKNATKTLTAHPAKILSATSEQDLVEFIKDALANNKRIRPAGGGHSWYPLVLTDQEPDNDNYYIVEFSKMKAVSVGNGNRLNVEPGATMGDLTPVMQSSGRAFSTEGVIPTQIELGGFVAAGCHGTGWQQPTIPDLVHSITLVLSITDGSGNPYVCTFSDSGIDECYVYQGGNKVSAEPPASIKGIAGVDFMSALRVNLGSMGIMSMITFNTVPMFQLYAQDTTENTMEDIISQSDSTKLQNVVENNDYVELFWFPYNSLTPSCNIDIKNLHSLSEAKQWLELAACIAKVGIEIALGTVPSILPSKIWLKTENKQQPPSPPAPPLPWPTTPPKSDPFATWLGGEVLNGILLTKEWLIMLYGLHYLVDAPAYLQANDHYVADAPQVFNYQETAFPIIDFSWAIPMDMSTPASSTQAYQNIAAAWYAVVNSVAAAVQNKNASNIYERFPVNVTLHARFIKNSAALISPAYQPAGSDTTHTCFIEFLSYAIPQPDTGDGADAQTQSDDYYAAWTAYCQKIGAEWEKIGGQRARPHWAKDWQTMAPAIYTHVRQSFQYGATNNLDTFKSYRDTIDPSQTFMSPDIEKIFAS